MKKIACLVSAFLLICISVFAQETIEGDRILDLIGKDVSDPLFQQLKKQETFYTDAWSNNFTIYITRTSANVIESVELQNGKKRYGSNERYGNYEKKLPLKLNWGMTIADYTSKFGAPVLESATMSMKDYVSNGIKIRMMFEGDKVVSVSFAKTADSKTYSYQPPKPAKPAPAPVSGEALLQYTEKSTVVSWPVLRQLIVSGNNLKPFTTNDSVDYIGQVYYGSKYKAEGFERTAIKRNKRTGQWYYEAFLKTSADTNTVKNIFFSLYDGIKKVMTENGGDDFLNVSVAKEAISHAPVNWMVAWTVKSNSQIIPGSTGKNRLLLMISGMKNVFKENRMEYTIKVYIHSADVNYDFFTWDKPL